MPKTFCGVLLLELQELAVHLHQQPTDVVLLQDDRCHVLLMKNGRSSAGKRTRHMKIKHFHVTDAHNQGDLETQCYSTNDMTADCMMKALQGTKCCLLNLCQFLSICRNKCSQWLPQCHVSNTLLLFNLLASLLLCFLQMCLDVQLHIPKDCILF